MFGPSIILHSKIPFRERFRGGAFQKTFCGLTLEQKEYIWKRFKILFFLNELTYKSEKVFLTAV